MENETIQHKGEILIVDDTQANLQLLMELLLEQSYKVRPAIDGEQALTAIHKRKPDLILLDIKMPGLDGYEVCRRLKNDESTKDIPIIFISALSDLDDRVKGFNLGAVDFITKPFQREEVLIRIQNHIQLRKMQLKLEDLIDSRTLELQDANMNMHVLLLQMIKAFSMTVEKRDPYTAGHQQHVSELAVAIAEQMELDENTIEGIKLGAMIHDIGKIYVPSEILNRPGRISDIEFKIIQTHPQVGYEIVKDIVFPWPVIDMIVQHHERLNGSGYPKGLKGDEINLEARIIAVADVVEAIASHRPYRPSLGIDKALEEISKNRGKLYDTQVVDCCLSLFKENKFQFLTN